MEVEPGKTLWDWISLLLVPVVLAIGGTAFTFVQDSRQQDLEDRRAQADALQAYLDQMSTLLIDEAPTTVIEEGDEKKQRPLQDPTAITVARARTLTILGRVDSDPRRPTDEEPKRTVLQFLYEARLIQRDQPMVKFRDANLEQSNLETMVMPHTNLSGANLSGARLVFADLSDADLSDARLDDNVLDADGETNPADLHNANQRLQEVRRLHWVCSVGSNPGSLYA